MAEKRLSQVLSEKLQKTILENELMIVGHESMLEASHNLQEVVEEIRGAAVVVPTKPEIDPKKKEDLLQGLEVARQAREKQKRQQEERKAQMLRNLAMEKKKRREEEKKANMLKNIAKARSPWRTH